jgi:hypothetical protein
MDSEDDWLMRPVIDGLCRFESLKDGSLDLLDVAIMNHALDIRQENERLYRKANA